MTVYKRARTFPHFFEGRDENSFYHASHCSQILTWRADPYHEKVSGITVMKWYCPCYYALDKEDA